MTKVAAVKADSYNPQIVQQAITELLAHLGGMYQFIQSDDRVFFNGINSRFYIKVRVKY